MSTGKLVISNATGLIFLVKKKTRCVTQPLCLWERQWKDPFLPMLSSQNLGSHSQWVGWSVSSQFSRNVALRTTFVWGGEFGTESRLPASTEPLWALQVFSSFSRS